MKKLVVVPMFFFLALNAYWLAACSPPPAALPPTGGQKSAPAARAAWEQKWEQTVTEARKEGVVSIYTTAWAPETRTGLGQAFKEKFGVNLEFTPFVRGAELAARVQQEKAAGLSVVDIIGSGGGTTITIMKPAHLLGSLEPLLLLPEVLDPGRWRGNQVPFIDKDKQIFPMIAAVNRYILYNTDMIKRGEITTYRDVLKPQYRGKITLNDPTVTGAGNAMMGHLGFHIWNAQEAKDFLRQLLKQQQAVIQRDNRLHAESVARGKFAIGMAPNTQNVALFLVAGAPLEMVIPPEGAYVTFGAGAVSVPTKLAHPNAAALFINWLLTKEGQTILSRSWGGPSMRTDVTTEGIDPIFIAQPGEKIFLPTEESFEFWGKMLQMAQEVVKETAK